MIPLPILEASVLVIDYETNKNSLFYLLKVVVFRIKCYLFKNESLTTLFNTIDKIKAEGYNKYY